jgi:hypothetical protein
MENIFIRAFAWWISPFGLACVGVFLAGLGGFIRLRRK